jgi:hypothetical protein
MPERPRRTRYTFTFETLPEVEGEPAAIIRCRHL